MDLPLVVAAYLLGSVSFPWLIAWWHGVDLREAGSRKLGGSNLAHVLAARWGLAGGALDLAKGSVAVLLAAAFGLPVEMRAFCALAVVAGQMWPIFHGLDGGRANATAWGTIVVLDPVAAIPCAILMLAAAGARFALRPHPSRLVPLAAILSFVVWPVAVHVTAGPRSLVVGGGLIFALILVRRVTAGLTDDVATGAPLPRILFDRALFDRSQLQERGVVPI
ncbi:MAG: glycerol-3-phosphate acyltransferase [Chloroflexota bacterium]|nr:glycerol-3-phosphate acyltransferase [Chloroflexota bacterium]MDE3101493.1 glycerol-3-phosphate acyltransferase [Chloroflexota bacterium]